MCFAISLFLVFFCRSEVFATVAVNPEERVVETSEIKMKWDSVVADKITEFYYKPLSFTHNLAGLNQGGEFFGNAMVLPKDSNYWAMYGLVGDGNTDNSWNYSYSGNKLIISISSVSIDGFPISTKYEFSDESAAIKVSRTFGFGTKNLEESRLIPYIIRGYDRQNFTNYVWEQPDGNVWVSQGECEWGCSIVDWKQTWSDLEAPWFNFGFGLINLSPEISSKLWIDKDWNSWTSVVSTLIPTSGFNHDLTTNLLIIPHVANYNYIDWDSYLINITPTPTPTSISLNVPMFKQTYPNWQNQTYDGANVNALGCGSTIGQCGCALSSIAMVLKYFGVHKDPDGNPTTPERLNNYFNQDKKCGPLGCTSLGFWYGQVKWSAADQYSADVNKVFNSQKVIFTGYKNYFDSQYVNQQISLGNPVIVRVPGREHWVVVKSEIPGSFSINDPGYNRLALNDPAYQNTGLAMRGYEKTSSDFSRFEAASLAPGQLLVIDQEGRKTGFDLETNTVKDEIPNSTYVFEASYADATEENPVPEEGSGIYIVSIATPEKQEFKVLPVNTNENYSFTVHASDRDAGLEFNIFEGMASSEPYMFSYSPDPNEMPLVENINIKIDSLQDINKRGEGYTETKVLIFSTENFDASSEIDRNSLRFGPTGQEFSEVKFNNIPRDFNRDGKNDLAAYFKIQRSGFGDGVQKVYLKAKNINGLNLKGEAGYQFN